MTQSSNHELGESIARQQLNLFFIIDNSGSMKGERIGAVNNAMRDVASILPEIQEDTADCEIKVSVLVFSSNANWLTPTPQSADQFKWKDIVDEGSTNLGSAYLQLEEKLNRTSKGGIMPDFGGIAPILFLMTDGIPDDGWKHALQKLQMRAWYQQALKYALAIGIDSEEAMKVLTQFTQTEENVIRVYSAEALRKVIKVVAVTASKVKSKTSSGTEATQQQIATAEIADSIATIEGAEQGWGS